MKRAILGLIIVVGLALVVMIQNDWLNITPKKDGVELTVDKEKGIRDIKAGTQAVKEAGESAVEKAKEVGEKVVDKTKEAAEAVKDKVTGGNKEGGNAGTEKPDDN